MKKTKLTRSLLAACSIVALTAVMYGCTGDGAENDLKATQGDLEEVQAQLKAANDKIAMLEGQVSGLEGDLSTANGDLMTARNRVTELEGDLSTANGDLMTARNRVTELEGDLMTARNRVTELEGDLSTSNSDLMTARNRVTELEGDLSTANGDLMTARNRVTELEGDLSTANSDLMTARNRVTELKGLLTTAEGERDKYKKMLDDAAQDIADKEMLDRGKAVAAAISMNRVSTDPGTNAARETPNATGTFDALASQLPFDGAAGVSAERGHDGMVTVDVTLTDTEATKFAGDAASAGTTWTGAMVTRNLGEGTTASEETLMVYTDIGAPTAWPLATEFSAGESFIAITDAAGLGRVMVDSAPAVGDDRTFNYAENAEFTGSYRGVPGTFTCGAGGCTVSTAENGTVTVTGTMNFEPTDPAATYPRQDASYVYFGWWLNKPASATADHMVEAFAGTNGGTAANTTTAMEGKATYTGPAIGKYVVQTSTAGVVTSAEAGHFTALATLNADFGDETELGTLSGKVDGFDTSGDADGSAWRVNLKETAIVDGQSAYNARTSVSFGGLTADNAGAWRGTFYDAGTGDAAPGTIIGTFDAHDAGGSANISGAFGAKKQ